MASVELYFDTCASHMSTPFKEYFFTLNEDQTSVTLNGIASGITIQDTWTVNYIMHDDTGKPYTMMVEKYWVPESKQWLASHQDLHTE